MPFTAKKGAAGNGSRSHVRSEEHTSELQSRQYLVCRLLLEKKNNYIQYGGYFYFPSVSEGTFNEYRPSIKLVGEDGKQLEFDFNLDSLRLMVQKKGSNGVKVFSDDGYKYCLFFFKATAPPDNLPFSPHHLLPN